MSRPRWIILRTMRTVGTLIWSFKLHTDSLPAEEIEKLRKEAQALKQIREAMGTDAFPQLLFDKVYKDDVIRLRSMEEMWKTRRPPESIDYASVFANATDAEAKKQNILKDGQSTWSLEENLVVFKDR